MQFLPTGDPRCIICHSPILIPAQQQLGRYPGAVEQATPISPAVWQVILQHLETSELTLGPPLEVLLA